MSSAVLFDTGHRHLVMLHISYLLLIRLGGYKNIKTVNTQTEGNMKMHSWVLKLICFTKLKRCLNRKADVPHWFCHCWYISKHYRIAVNFLEIVEKTGKLPFLFNHSVILTVKPGENTLKSQYTCNTSYYCVVKNKQSESSSKQFTTHLPTEHSNLKVLLY